MSDLAIPGFLARPRSSQPLQLLLSNLNRRRWRRIRLDSPGDDWVLIEVHAADELAPIPCGRRKLWMREGRRFVKLRSLTGEKRKMSMREWAILRRRIEVAS